MAILTREQLLAKQELKIEKVKLSIGEVYVRPMSGRAKNEFDLSLGHWDSYEEDGVSKERWVRSMDDFRAKLAVWTLCDKDGNLLLQPGDVEALSQNMSGADLERIAVMAQQLNAITEVAKAQVRKN